MFVKGMGYSSCYKPLVSKKYGYGESFFST